MEDAAPDPEVRRAKKLVASHQGLPPCLPLDAMLLLGLRCLWTARAPGPPPLSSNYVSVHFRAAQVEAIAETSSVESEMNEKALDLTCH